MSHEMFHDVVKPSLRLGSRKWWTVPLSIVAHVALLGTMIVIPLLAAATLPIVASAINWVPVDIVLPPPPPPAPIRSQPSQPVTPALDPGVAPVEAPRGIALEPATTVDISPGPAVVLGAIGSTSDLARFELPPPAPPPPTATEPSRPVPVGGKILRPVKVYDVAPAYPAIAQAARVQGIVIIECAIGPDGRVQNAKILRSIPLLDAAALDAVRQWRFTPTLLNGVPVAVVMTVTVNFQLQ